MSSLENFSPNLFSRMFSESSIIEASTIAFDKNQQLKKQGDCAFMKEIRTNRSQTDPSRFRFIFIFGYLLLSSKKIDPLIIATKCAELKDGPMKAKSNKLMFEVPDDPKPSVLKSLMEQR